MSVSREVFQSNHAQRLHVVIKIHRGAGVMET